jgi:hypothetical protein
MMRLKPTYSANACKAPKSNASHPIKPKDALIRLPTQNAGTAIAPCPFKTGNREFLTNA